MLENVIVYAQQLDIAELGVWLLILASVSALFYTVQSVFSTVIDIIMWPFYKTFVRRIELTTGDPFFIEVQKWLNDNDQHFYLNRSFKFTGDWDSSHRPENTRECEQLSKGYGVSYLKIPNLPLIRVSREKRDTNSLKQQDILNLQIYSSSKKGVDIVNNKIREYVKKDYDAGPFVYQYTDGYWQRTGNVRKVLCPTSKASLEFVQDVVEFDNDKPMYEKRGVAHKRCYLLHGEPGTGKTSIVLHLANTLNKHIFILNEGPMQNVDEMLIEVKEGGILLLDDLDRSSFVGTKTTVDAPPVTGKDTEVDPKPKKAMYAAAKDPMTNANRTKELMSALDGPVSKELLVIATANDKSLLDPALIRNGRLGVHYHVGKLNSKEQLDHINQFYETEFKGITLKDRVMADLQEVLNTNMHTPEEALKILSGETVKRKETLIDL